MVAGFVLAMIVNEGIHWKGAIRGMVFLPYVSNMVAVVFIHLYSWFHRHSK